MYFETKKYTYTIHIFKVLLDLKLFQPLCLDFNDLLVKDFFSTKKSIIMVWKITNTRVCTVHSLKRPTNFLRLVA